MKSAPIFRFITGILTISFLIILSAKTVSAEVEPYNFAPNPSFEEGSSSPSKWTPLTWLWCGREANNFPGTFTWSSERAKSGSKSIAITDVVWNFPWNPQPATWLSDLINIENVNQDFELSYYVSGLENNSNITPAPVICSYNNDGTLKDVGRGQQSSPPIASSSWTKIKQTFAKGIEPYITSSIRIGLGTECINFGICSGSLWFDDISFHPIYRVRAYAFDDANGNGTEERPPEWPFFKWKMELFKGPDCNGQPVDSGQTTMNGYVVLSSLYSESHSILETPPQFWGVPYPPICKNVFLIGGEIPLVIFANSRRPPAPTFPYFSQKDPVWGGQEYDSATTYGPFFCGKTLAQCGCATTSSAMLLKYWGVDKSPNGDPTNPETLNNWLKANNGYAFGALKWNSIAAYSVKANAVHGTQKIKFSGIARSNNVSTLNADLNSNSPPILQEPGHFIVATGIQSPTYSIADPAWIDRKTLQSYDNTFQSMRRFEKTNTDLSAIFVATPAPTDLLITDSQGRKAGKDEAGNIYNQIPDSYYALEPAFSDQSAESPQTPPENLGVNTLVILTPDQQNYTLETFSQSPDYSIEFSGYDEDGDITVQNFDQTNADQFDINYSQNSSHFGFFQAVEIDARHAANSNPFNPKARILPLSILASEDFDPQSVDINTIDAGPNWNLLKTSSILVGPRLGDGKSLLLLFENNGNYQEEICISGKTLGGEPFRGCDAITAVGNSP